MKIKSLLKLIIIAIFSALVVWAVAYFILLPKSDQNETTTVVSDSLFGWKYPVVRFPTTGPGELSYSNIRDPGGIPEGLPVRLRIPAISVNTAIEDALITPDGRMDVPAGSRNVAWFALGPHPGREGSAVIGGHFGISNGVKFVFYDLDKLQVGDKIYIEDDKGDTLTFQVRKIELFNRDADATTVFTSDDGLAHLNLITCEGIWNRVNDTYPQRRVVFTDLVPTEGEVPESPTSSVDFPRSLSVGARGVDVISLQTVLEQKGLLTIPSGIAKGFFGELTRSAVSRYQVSVGLPSAGFFGPLTRAKLILETKPVEKPLLPSTDTVVSESEFEAGNVTKLPAFLQIIISSFKSLYATPKDAAITSFFFIFILLMVVKIVRR